MTILKDVCCCQDFFVKLLEAAGVECLILVVQMFHHSVMKVQVVSSPDNYRDGRPTKPPLKEGFFCYELDIFICNDVWLVLHPSSHFE